MVKRKNHAANILCTLIFGPVGLMYAERWVGFVAAALFFLSGGIFLGMDTTSLSGGVSSSQISLLTDNWGIVFGVWLVPMVIGAIIVKYHNEDVQEHEFGIERRHRELLQALQNQRL